MEVNSFFFKCYNKLCKIGALGNGLLLKRVACFRTRSFCTQFQVNWKFQNCIAHLCGMWAKMHYFVKCC